jgi:hypothetical protein
MPAAGGYQEQAGCYRKEPDKAGRFHFYSDFWG